MSADAFVLYYGIRLPVPEPDDPEFELYELRTHPRQVAAQNAGLDSWWGEYGLWDEEQLKYFIFIGHEFGIFGAEENNELSVGDTELLRIMEATRVKLNVAGFQEEPMLWAQYEPDK